MIKLAEIYRTSNRALLRHKGRTVLTMLGVIIGVFAVVSLVSLGIGVQNYIQDQFEDMGSNVVFVMPGKMDFGDDPAKNFGNVKLEDKHIDMLETYVADKVDLITPNVFFGKTIEYKSKSFYASIYGVTASAGELFGVDIESGRFWTTKEDDNSSKVTVIGPLIAEDLFPNTDPLGKKIKIDGNSYEVIGIAEKKGEDYDEIAYIPYARVVDDFDTKTLTSIAMRAKNADEIDITMKEVKFALLRDLDEDDFSVVSAEDILATITEILGIMTAAIEAIAGISLLVGGIGIMNIMLVSVTERIKEIGLRKALGATRRDIAVQFMIEAVLISVGGGGIGLLFGWLASLAARSFVRTEVPLWTVALSFGFSVMVGMIFGTYPAIKASKKDPIEALRFE